MRTKRSKAKYGAVLEEMLAARWWGMTPRQWDALMGDEKSRCVAVYRVSSQYAAIEAAETSSNSSEGETPE